MLCFTWKFSWNIFQTSFRRGISSKQNAFFNTTDTKGLIKQNAACSHAGTTQNVETETIMDMECPIFLFGDLVNAYSNYNHAFTWWKKDFICVFLSLMSHYLLRSEHFQTFAWNWHFYTFLPHTFEVVYKIHSKWVSENWLIPGT